MAGQVVSWNDTQVVAAVASGSLTGIVRIQQSGFWSNALSFTVPPISGTAVTLVPNLMNLSVGDTPTIQAVDSSGHSVTGLTWTSSDTTVISLSTDDPPILTALAPGHVTITAGTASADVTVFSGPLPIGTVIWSNPGAGSGVRQIMPAVPSQTGVADVFAIQQDGTIQAITSDGTIAWTANVGQAAVRYGTILPDFQGGLIVESDTSPDTIYKLDGLTGQAYPAYTFDVNSGPLSIVVHPDGTIFARVWNYTSQGAVGNGPGAAIGIDPSTGAQKFSMPVLGYQWVNMIVAGDGYAYLSHVDNDADVNMPTQHVKLLRISSSGAYTDFDIFTGQRGDAFLGENAFPYTASAYVGNIALISNGADGVLMSWDEAYYVDEGHTGTDVPHLTTVSSAGVSDASGPHILHQQQAIAPILQREDGSFIGLAYVGDPYSSFSQWTPYMVAFDAGGGILWSVPNAQPQIATADGGVIGKSGITYDQNGGATGQMNPYTQSWTLHSYQIGSVEQIVKDAIRIATSWWPLSNGNASSNGTAQRPWFQPLQTCPGAATPCPQEAVWSALSALKTFIASCPDSVCKTLVYDKLGGTISRDTFLKFLSRQNIGLYDGPKSYAPPIIAFSIPQPPSTTVHDYFQLVQPDAAAKTPSRQWEGPQIFFNPATGICNVFSVSNPQSGDKGVLNQATIFHEALHGWTAKVDYSPVADNLEKDLLPTNQVLPVPSNQITFYLKDQVLFPTDAGNLNSRSCGN